MITSSLTKYSEINNIVTTNIPRAYIAKILPIIVSPADLDTKELKGILGSDLLAATRAKIPIQTNKNNA